MRVLRLSLVGALLLVFGVLSGAVMAKEESEAAFPTGTFVSEQNSYLLLEFREDGTAYYRDALDGWDYPFPYAVDGDLVTRGPVDWPGWAAWTPSPTTWRWGYDGERLTLFESESGQSTGLVIAANTFRPIEEPRAVVVAAIDLEAGEPILEWQLRNGFVPLAEVAPKLYLSPTLFVGNVPVAPIAKGRPLTLESAPPAG